MDEAFWLGLGLVLCWTAISVLVYIGLYQRWLRQHERKWQQFRSQGNLVSTHGPSAAPLVQALGGDGVSAWTRQLKLAGYSGSLPWLPWLLLSMGLALAGALAGASAASQWQGAGAFVLVTLIAFAALLAGSLPWWWLVQRVRRVQAKVQTHFANAMDLMGVCLDGGLGMDAALQRVAHALANDSPQLSRALYQVGLQLQAGASHAQALAILPEYLELQGLSILLLHLTQAEQLGTSVSSALRTYAHEIRVRQRVQAEERNGRLPTLLIFPLVFCQLPALLAVMIGPSVLITVRMLQGLWA